MMQTVLLMTRLDTPRASSESNVIKYSREYNITKSNKLLLVYEGEMCKGV